jgi:hypothetical protein
MMRATLLAATACSAANATPAPDPAPILVRPVAMFGPYKSVLAACTGVKPCGFRELEYRGPDDAWGHLTKPATKTSCPAIASGEDGDPHAALPDYSGMAALIHHAKPIGLDLRIASQHCDVPDGLREARDIYYVFVKRADGWWRTAPLWQWDYNDKYGGGTMLVRWNDRPGRTFVGVAAGETFGAACGKQGAESDTLELMFRIEPGDKQPIVFGPLVVGERYQLELYPNPDDRAKECKNTKHADELVERWLGDDELELTGPATWREVSVEDGVLRIGLGDRKTPSSIGRYRFTR